MKWGFGDICDSFEDLIFCFLSVREIHPDQPCELVLGRQLYVSLLEEWGWPNYLQKFLPTLTLLSFCVILWFCVVSTPQDNEPSGQSARYYRNSLNSKLLLGSSCLSLLIWIGPEYSYKKSLKLEFSGLLPRSWYFSKTFGLKENNNN